jgi:2-C-methyl-D-erythritol 4-phosphate cytidylyltransferase
VEPESLGCYAANSAGFRVDVLRSFWRRRLLRIHRTDDAEIVERIGVPVTVVSGDPSNIKITDRSDLIAAERWLQDQLGNETGGAA